MSATWVSVGERLARSGANGDPFRPLDGSGRQLSEELARGTPVPDAFQRAGLPSVPVELARVAVPPDPLTGFTAAAEAMQAQRTRLRVLRGSGAYAAWIAIGALVLALLSWGLVRPLYAAAMQDRAGAPLGTFVPASWLAAAVIVSLVVLAYLVFSLTGRRLRFPFRAFGQTNDRAASVAIAAEWAKQGVPLPQAVRAGAVACLDPTLRRDARHLAEAMERGEEGDLGRLWLGALGAPLFRQSASVGTGTIALATLAQVFERQAAADVMLQRTRAELWSVIVGAVAVAAAAIAFYGTYVHSMVGG